jgi:hypothetical protein
VLNTLYEMPDASSDRIGNNLPENRDSRRLFYAAAPAQMEGRGAI